MCLRYHDCTSSSRLSGITFIIIEGISDQHEISGTHNHKQSL